MMTLCNSLVRVSTVGLPMSSALLPPGTCHAETKQDLFFFILHAVFYATYYFIVENRLTL